MRASSKYNVLGKPIITAIIGVLVVLGFVFVLPNFAHAQTPEMEQLGAASGLSQQYLPVIIARIIRAVLGVLGIITVIIVLYGGFLFLTSAGDPGKVEKAKKILTNAIIGLAIIFSAYSIASFILNRLLEAGGLAGIGGSGIENYIEPLSGSLGRGIINDHYPQRGAIDVPRNTLIMITFKQKIRISSIVAGFDDDSSTVYEGFLNTENVKIYPTEGDRYCSESPGILRCGSDADCTGTCEFLAGEDAALDSTMVNVYFDPNEQLNFVFDPVEFLGNSQTDTNYTVALKTGILKDDGTPAFSGSEVDWLGDGYEWTFEVSTEIDMTPPHVVSASPITGGLYDKNITVSVTFNEPMNSMSMIGEYDPTNAARDFTNIRVNEPADSDGDGTPIVLGTYTISNGYKTVDFTTFDHCADDPCGDPIYCLPGNADLDAEVIAATVDVGNEPRAQIVAGRFDGAVDAAANSLDGDADWQPPLGEAGDDYPQTPTTWAFSTTNNINDTPPIIKFEGEGGLSHGINTGPHDFNAPVSFMFQSQPQPAPMPSVVDVLKSSTVNTGNIQLLPDGPPPVTSYELWFRLNYDPLTGTASIDHATLLDSVWNYYYYPLITHGLKSNYQICMFPSEGPGNQYDKSCIDDMNPEANPFCCNGSPKSGAAACLGAKSGLQIYTFPPSNP